MRGARSLRIPGPGDVGGDGERDAVGQRALDPCDGDRSGDGVPLIDHIQNGSDHKPNRQGATQAGAAQGRLEPTRPCLAAGLCRSSGCLGDGGMRGLLRHGREFVLGDSASPRWRCGAPLNHRSTCGDLLRFQGLSLESDT